MTYKHHTITLQPQGTYLVSRHNIKIIGGIRTLKDAMFQVDLLRY